MAMIETEQVEKVLWFDSLSFERLKKTPDGGVVGVVKAVGSWRATDDGRIVGPARFEEPMEVFYPRVAAAIGAGAGLVDAFAIASEQAYKAAVAGKAATVLPFNPTPGIIREWPEPPVVEPEPSQPAEETPVEGG